MKMRMRIDSKTKQWIIMENPDNKTSKTIRLPNDLIQEINQLASHENRNFSNMTETLILRGIGLTKNTNEFFK